MVFLLKQFKSRILFKCVCEEWEEQLCERYWWENEKTNQRRGENTWKRHLIKDCLSGPDKGLFIIQNIQINHQIIGKRIFQLILLDAQKKWAIKLWKEMEETWLHLTKWKKLIMKGYKLSDSNDTTFQEKQNYEDNKVVPVWFSQLSIQLWLSAS